MDTSDGWRSRIVGHGEAPPAQLIANPRNWRVHPKAQQEALAAVLEQVGWVQDVIVNQRTGYVVDGHARLDLARKRGETSVPVVYVDLDEREERLIIASLDPLSAMATTDAEALRALLADIAVYDEALADMFVDLAGVVDEVAFPDLAVGGQSDARTMTFILTADQQAVVEAAIEIARKHKVSGTGNVNRNGNALSLICQAYQG